MFTDSELAQNPRLENLAGMFAAKEACMKAFGKKIDWHDVWIEIGVTRLTTLRSFLSGAKNLASERLSQEIQHLRSG